MTTTEVRSDVTGFVVAVDTPAGTTVKPGDTIIVLESMKMEIAIAAPVKGTVASVAVSVGDTVEERTLLAVLRAEAS